jgi:hypothetical protein
VWALGERTAGNLGLGAASAMIVGSSMQAISRSQ